MSRPLVVTVIPVHLREPSELEKISLTQLLVVLPHYPIAFMAPFGLDTTWYEDFCRGKADVSIVRFAWKGHRQYSELILSPLFYKAFQEYQFMLTYHLDAFVFRDELTQWCQLNYDFIGSVIYNPIWQQLNTPLRNKIGFGVPGGYFGNGGFSLKKIDSFYRLTSTFRLFITGYDWFARKRKALFLDDLFVARYFPKLSPSFRIAPREVAQRFGAAYEEDDVMPLPFDGQDIDALPFGTHGWIQFKPEFWKPSIRHYGHQL